MAELTRAHFDTWMTAYGQASADDDPRASAELFSADARYYESPFDDPVTGSAAIFAYWEKGARNLRDKSSSFDVIAIHDNTGVARWRSAFTVIDTGERFALDCLFVAEFDDEGLCCEFREWWHRREVTS